jgi:hypothetical protein
MFHANLCHVHPYSQMSDSPHRSPGCCPAAVQLDSAPLWELVPRCPPVGRKSANIRPTVSHFSPLYAISIQFVPLSGIAAMVLCSAQSARCSGSVAFSRESVPDFYCQRVGIEAPLNRPQACRPGCSGHGQRNADRQRTPSQALMGSLCLGRNEHATAQSRAASGSPACAAAVAVSSSHDYTTS